MPLILLAGAIKAVEAIQQGCEMYKEYKGTVLKAKKTFDEVKGIANEVTSVSTGIWGFLKSKFFADEPPPQVVAPKAIEEIKKITKPKEEYQEFDEQSVKADLIKNLKIFFKAMIAMKKKIAEQQERIDHTEIHPDELLDISLDHVVALKEMEKLQKEIREIMVYQSPPELGALYTDVVNMFGIVQEKQEATHLLNMRKKKEAHQRKQMLVNKFHRRISWVVVVAIIILEVWGLLLTIHLARAPI
jgi:hypothetical protein